MLQYLIGLSILAVVLAMISWGCFLRRPKDAEFYGDVLLLSDVALNGVIGIIVGTVLLIALVLIFGIYGFRYIVFGREYALYPRRRPNKNPRPIAPPDGDTRD